MDSPAFAAFEDAEEARVAAIFEEMDGKDVPWANVIVDIATGANVVAFASGYGDGAYPSYFGYDARDRLLCLVTDFAVLAS